MRAAARFGVADIDADVVGLAGFLIRGGVVVLAIPSVVLPSLLGIAGVFGVNALGIDGHPTSWLISIIVLSCALGALWLAAACLLGSLVDVWLIRAALAAEPRIASRPQPLPDFGLLLDMAAIRALCLVPLGIVIAVVSQFLYDAVYSELTLPTNLASPLLVRVVERAALPLALVVVTWLITETVAAVAVRRLVIRGYGFWPALGGALTQLVRRPLTSVSTMLVTSLGSVASISMAMAITAFAFQWCLDAARLPNPVALTLALGPLNASRDLRPLIFVGAALALGLAWVAGLAIAGMTSAWRSAAWTGETRAASHLAGAAVVAAPPEPIDASPTTVLPRHTAGS
jgi:hypothetical protein